MSRGWCRRVAGELSRAWAILVKDVRVYYLQPPMIMFGLLMPFFIFFSFSVRRGMGVESSMARLLALTTFFTASSAGPVIVPLERRERTYDRLLTAPMSIWTLLLGKALVGIAFGLVVSLVPLLAGVLVLGGRVAAPGLVALALLLSTTAFSALGLLLASLPAQSVGSIMMPSTLLRWPLLFISGVFVPLSEMAPWTRALSYLSPLTYSQDMLYGALDGWCVQPLGLNLLALVLTTGLFLALAVRLHRTSRRLGY